MSFIVLDMEWNQYYPARAPRNAAGVIMRDEIIQIGAVKLDATFSEQDTFKVYVKLNEKRKLNKHVAEITAIDPEEIRNGLEFPDAIEQFRTWCGELPVFFTWGYDDLPVLRRNLEYYRMDMAWTQLCFNLQLIYNWQHQLGKNQVSLMNAVAQLGIAQDLPPHDALNDAIYTARVAQSLPLVEGLAVYNALPIALPKPKAPLPEGKPLGGVVLRGFSDRNAAYAHRDIQLTRCPVCGSALLGTQNWTRQNNAKMLCLLRCPQHGALTVRLRFVRDGKTRRWIVSKHIYEASAADLTFFAKPDTATPADGANTQETPSTQG